MSRRNTALACTFLVLTVFLQNCGKSSDPVAPPPEAPVACFTMTSQLESGAACLYQLNFVLNATCATDNRTPAESLEVRWDYENDGTWDTGFSRSRVDATFVPDPTASLWSARCQVRDGDGNITEATRTMALGPYPTSPDLIAGDITFRLFGPVDTVRVNEDFTLTVNQTCYGDFNSPFWKARILRDGVVVDSLEAGCSGTLFGCGGAGRGGWRIGTPGTYQFSAILDADGVYAETNESNNTARGTLVVVP